MDKKILITGSGGFVGKNLYQIFGKDCKVFGVDRNENNFVDGVIDIRCGVELERALDSFKPEIIVHLAALSNVEKCETEQQSAYESNVLPTKILAQWSEKNNARLIYMSSDYVYDGGKGNFTEEDLEHPLQYYGQTKLESEKIVFALKDYIVLRPTVIYGWDPSGMNFFMQVYRNQMAHKEMRVPIDQISNPTFVVDLCNLIKKVAETENKNGKYIATGNESLSRYDFALKICNYFNWNKNLLVPAKTSELNQIAKRPLNNSTSSQKVCETFDFKFNNIANNLTFIKTQMDNEL